MSMVLVTGAAGFLGSYVAREAAARGHQVTGVGHGAPPAALASWREADVTSDALDALETAPEVIFHCAGGASVAHSIEQPLRDFQRTVDTTAAVLDYARRVSAKVVLPSSAAVYGGAETLPSRVGHALNPASPYGLHKKMAEDLCRGHARLFGLRTAIVRLFSVYGPGLRKQLLWDACGKLTRGEATFSGTGGETRDWLHVRDAAALMLAAADQASADCPTVNGATGQSVATGEILRELAASLGGAGVEFSGVRRPGDPLHYQADISEALAWGWKPGTSLKAGLAEYADWFKAEPA